MEQIKTPEESDEDDFKSPYFENDLYKAVIKDKSPGDRKSNKSKNQNKSP